jgi:glycosyltransferase involved in cell wall biosynthesis
MSNATRLSPSPEHRAPAVLQVLPALVTGGVERGTIDVALALAAAGWNSVVASSGGPMVRELSRAGINHIVLPLDSKNPLTMRANAKALEELIKTHGIDIVHARSRAPAWSAYWAATATKRHFVTTFHGTYSLGMMGLKQRYNSVMTKGERVIAISRFIADHVQSVYHLDPERIRVIYRGVDFDRFDAKRVSQERIIQLARRWRLPDGHKVIMLPGRLTRWKGQSVLIDALAILGRRDIRCLLVGSDQGRSAYVRSLRKQVEENGLQDVVHITGECNDMAAAYMLADVVVSASAEPEAFGRVIAEGQAMGRPVIATDHGAGRETIVESDPSLLVPPNDSMALAHALDRVLIMSEAERAALAQRQIAWVHSRFARQEMCDKTLAVYREMIGQDRQVVEAEIGATVA